MLGSVYTFRITGTYTFQAGKIATAALTLDPIDGSGSSLTAVGQMSFTTSDWSAGNVATVGAVGELLLSAYFWNRRHHLLRFRSRGRISRGSLEQI